MFEPLMLEECFALMQRGVVESEDLALPRKCVTGPATQVIVHYSDTRAEHNSSLGT